MLKTRHPRTTSRKTSTAHSPLTLGLQVTKQIASLFGVGGGGGAGGLGAGASSLGGIAELLGGGAGGTAGTTSLQAALTPNTSALIANTSALVANTSALTANTSALAAGTSALTANTASIAADSAAGIGSDALSLFGGSGAGGESFGGGGGGFLGSLLGGFGSLLGLGSLGSSLFSLFSGSTPQQTLTPYKAPPAQSLEVADSGNVLDGLPLVDSSADGTSRSYNGNQGTAAAQPMQVTVNVSAIDSSSFQDYAPQLADAVRQAMLNMNPINQMIRESF
jgi:hypothetical protein